MLPTTCTDPNAHRWISGALSLSQLAACIMIHGTENLIESEAFGTWDDGAGDAAVHDDQRKYNRAKTSRIKMHLRDELP